MSATSRLSEATLPEAAQAVQQLVHELQETMLAEERWDLARELSRISIDASFVAIRLRGGAKGFPENRDGFVIEPDSMT